MEEGREDLEEPNLNVQKWKSNEKYILVLLSWIIGLNNVMHIPELFLKGNIIEYTIAHITMMILFGIPLTFLELAISQYLSKSLKTWDLCPLFYGIGYSKIILICILQVYFNVLNSYMLLYTLSSFSKRWNGCDNWRNSSCYDYNVTKSSSGQRNNYQTIAEQFWFNDILSFQEDYNSLDWPRWETVLCLSINMFIVFLANIKGTKFLEKVLPYGLMISSLLIIIFTCAVITTPGSVKGLNYIFNIKIEVKTLLPWKQNSVTLDAFCNILYSVGLGLGGLSSIAAKSSFRSPVCAYAILLNLVNFGLTFIYAIIIFGLYGILSHYTKTGMNKIVQIKSKFGNNIFTIIPNGIGYLPGKPQIWVFIFYSSLFLKGLCSSILMVDIILQSIYELRPNMIKKSAICSFTCSLFVCLIGFFLHTNIGIIISTYLNEITYTAILPLMNCLQILAVVYFYGLLRLSEDLHFMLGFELSIYWKMSLIISSFSLPILTTVSIATFLREYYYSKFDFMAILHNCMLLIILLCIPVMATARIIKKRTWKKVLQSSKCWIFHLPDELRRSRNMFSTQNVKYEYVYEKNLLKNKLKKYEK